MKQIYWKFGRVFGAVIASVVINSAVVCLAFAQGAEPAAAAAGDADQGGAAGPSGATRALEMPVMYVTAAEVLRSASESKADIIRVEGLVSSQGWSAPQLVPFYYGKAADDTLDLQLIATSPQQSQKAEGFVPVTAMLALEPGHGAKGVRIRAGANAIELKQMPGIVKTEIKVNDCKECVGKKFAEKGKSPAGTGNVVREEDLPRGFRVIPPTRGVAGIVHNPNRINLILDDSNTIVMVFWE